MGRKRNLLGVPEEEHRAVRETGLLHRPLAAETTDFFGRELLEHLWLLRGHTPRPKRGGGEGVNAVPMRSPVCEKILRTQKMLRAHNCNKRRRGWVGYRGAWGKIRKGVRFVTVDDRCAVYVRDPFSACDALAWIRGMHKKQDEGRTDAQRDEYISPLIFCFFAFSFPVFPSKTCAKRWIRDSTRATIALTHSHFMVLSLANEEEVRNITDAPTTFSIFLVKHLSHGIFSWIFHGSVPFPIHQSDRIRVIRPDPTP